MQKDGSVELPPFLPASPFPGRDVPAAAPAAVSLGKTAGAPVDFGNVIM